MSAKLKTRYYVDFLLLLTTAIAAFSGLALWGWLAPPEKTRPTTTQSFAESRPAPPPGAPARRNGPPPERRESRDRNAQNPWDSGPTEPLSDDEQESNDVKTEGQVHELESQLNEEQQVPQEDGERFEHIRQRDAEFVEQEVNRGDYDPPRDNRGSGKNDAQAPPPRFKQPPRPQLESLPPNLDVDEKESQARLFWGLMRGDVIFGLSKGEWSIVYRWSSLVMFVLIIAHISMHARWFVRTTLLLNKDD